MGVAGIDDGALMVTLPDDTEVHPAALVTVNVYAPAARLFIVVLAPVPIVVIAPGLPVIVQLPGGNPLSTTDPVATVQLGCVMVPTVGAATTGGSVTVTVFDVAVQEGLLISLAVIVYVPGPMIKVLPDWKGAPPVRLY